jgi:group I intron endonuclease
MKQKNAKYKVYRATNLINGKIYIGFTGSFHARKASHKHNALFSLRKTKTKFYPAIRKYGWSNFEWDFLFESWDRDVCLTAERELIDIFNCVELGYNIDPGGKTGCPHFGKLNGMYGKTHTDKVKEKLGKIASKRFRGFSYEDLYGVEKATLLKQHRKIKSKQWQDQNDQTGNKNPNSDLTARNWIHSSGQSFIGTRCDLQKSFGIDGKGLSDIIRKRQKSHKGWRISQSLETSAAAFS